MSYEQYETSQEQGQPIELYQFIYGPTSASQYLYTNAEEEVSTGVGTFEPIAISRDNYHVAGKTDKNQINIRIPVKVEMSSLFTAYPPPQPVAVIIFQGHANDPANQFVAVWNGRVLSTAKEGREQVLTCESTIVSLKRPGLRRNYQYGCPYVLYGPGCFANKANATMQAQVEDVVDGNLVLSADWYGEIDPQLFVGGMIEWTSELGNESRTILRLTEENQLVLLGPIRGLAAEDTINIVRGCDHKKSGCMSHENILNYGGQPWIPLKNPAKYHPFW